MRFKTEKLGDFLYIKGRIGWKGLKKDEYLSDGVYRIINGEALTKDGIDWSKAGFISKERYEESPEIMLQNDDILISKDGTIGKLGFVRNLENPSTVASGIFVLRNLKPEMINIRFIYNYLSSVYFRNFIISRTEGSVIPHLYQKDFQNLYFPLPSLKEQNKIVDVLDIISCKIEINKMINNNLEQQLSSLFTHTFAGSISLASDDTCPMIGDLVTVIDNRGKTPPLTTETLEYPIIDVGALKGAGRIVDFNNCTKYVDQATYDTWFRSGHPKPWDILLSTVGSLAEMKIYLGTKGCMAQNVVALRATSISPLYLYQYLRFIRADLVAYNIGSVQPSIKVTHIIKHPIFVPEAAALRMFEETARAITQQLYANYNENESLKELRDTLLPKLMSGELDVSNLDI